jgi:hypothetical protein
MKTTKGAWVFLGGVLAAAIPAAGFAQSLSASLGATKLDGLANFADCQNQSVGYREKLIADRIDAKLGVSPALNAQEREAWQAEARALRAVTPSNGKFVPPSAQDPQRYLLSLTDSEQQAINSMSIRFGQEVNLECEKKYGGMTRYSPGSDQSGQKKYEEELRARMTRPIDIATVPLVALDSPFPKTQEQVAAEQRAARDAARTQQQAAVNSAMQGMQNLAAKQAACQEQAKTLRLSLLAEYLQKRLDASPGLSAQERADFEADIKATREGAAKGLDMPPAVDPANPMRAMMRLTPQDQVAYGEAFGTRYVQQLTSCQQAR